MKGPICVAILGALLFASCSELKTNLPAPVAPGIQVHPAVWGTTPADPGFHGRALSQTQPAWNDANCRVCHGGNYAGGTSGISCFKCHPAYPHAVTFAGPAGHQGYLMTTLFQLPSCQTCHGSSFTGGTITTVSCESSGCHADASGVGKPPTTCNTCHGVFRAAASLTGSALLLSAAPPRDVAGDSASSAPGVGAHQKHLVTGTTGNSVKCQECHTVPNAYNDPGHIGIPPTQVVAFNDTLARLITGDGSLIPAPSFNPATVTCANVYCHGNWRLTKASAPTIAQAVFADTATIMVGANESPVWTGGAAQAQCFSCHGVAPNKYTPIGHQDFDLTACYLCHGDVVDQNGNISNRAKHINGMIDLVSQFGGPRPMQ
ncbi:MAG TPA: CxxxxCH/CxxCH domain-containing protein [Bacteroidota bacterium]|nr:CxxxxCH/CxxCH domain-containing protein [Bacteroidota bacterium]